MDNISKTHSTRAKASHWAIAAFLLATPVLSQQDPACLIGGAQTDGFRYLWGGEMRHIFHRDTTAGRRLWIVGDGGQIRHSVANGAFQMQATPAAASQRLLDVYFLDDGAKGWAAGVGGRILTTSNSGQNWTYLNGAPEGPILNACGDPAVIWSTRFLSANRGFLCGVRTFNYTAQGGDLTSEWAPTRLFADATLQSELYATNYEFYGLELLGTPAGFVGVCVGQSWSGHPCAATGQSPGKGVVFYTDSSIPAAAGGRNWWITTTFDGTAPGHQGKTMEDPWDVEFEADPTDIRNATGYVVGGTGVGTGAIYKTTDSGRSFTLEAGGAGSGVSTQYGVAALANGRAISCGYSGQIHSRDPATDQWNSEPAGTFIGPLADVHAIGGDGDDSLIVGSWGFVRYSFNAAAPWNSINPASASGVDMLHRLEDISFESDLVGVTVGAKQAILETADGGCSWQQVNGDLTNAQIGGKLNAVALGVGGQGVAVGQALTTSLLEAPAYFKASSSSSWTPSNMSGATLPANVHLRDVVRSTATNCWAVGTEATSAGARPLVLFSYTGGASFLRVPQTLPADLVLTGITFLSANDGFAVGYTSANDVPKAYHVHFTGSSVSFSDVSPTGLVGRLNGIASRGTGFFSADVYAVGGDYTAGAERGYVLKFEPQAPVGQPPRFVLVSAAQQLQVPYRSVAMAQDGPLVLVGMENSTEEAVSEDFGKVLRFNGATWAPIKAQSDKYVRNIFLLSQTRGWGVCRSDAGATSSEFGAVNDSMLVIYDPF